MSKPHTRAGGASRWSNAFSFTSATSSAPKPQVLGASCTTSTRPVFFTLATMVSMSTGQRVRRSTISTSIPCLCASSAAATASYSIAPQASTVTCLPSRTIAALPRGTV